jgi:hypothetical protein
MLRCREYSIEKIAQFTLIFTVLLAVFIIYANKVDDLDFWWHLKSGELLYETHALPEKDRFSYTTEIPDSIFEMGKNEVAAAELPQARTNRFSSAGLKHSWFSQLILYVVFKIAGFKGIGILKSMVFVLAYLIIYLTMVKRGAGYLSSLFVLCLVALIGTDFNYTRPQIFSFLMFSCMLFVLYDFKTGGKSIYAMPAIMLIWANLHGAFILGVYVIVTFSLVELTKYFWANRSDKLQFSSLNKGQLRKIIPVSIISVLASLINPHSYKLLFFPLGVFSPHRKSLFMIIEEYQRPMLYEYHAYWFMLGLVVISTLILIKRKHLDLTELFLLIIFIVPSLRAIRFIPFFALGVAAFLSYSLTYLSTGIKEWNAVKNLFVKTGLSKADLKGSLTVFMALLSVVILSGVAVSGEVLKFDMGEKRYPSGAVTFIKEHGIPGNMFNHYNWGGYLIWNLYPDHSVFVDGRCLNETVFFHYKQIMKAANGNIPDKPLWNRLLNAYNINFILINAVSSDGKIIPLVDSLYASSEWKLIYSDGKSMIFLKDLPINQDIVRQYQLSKERIDDEIISECRQGIADTPATWGYYETLGYIYMKKNLLNEALGIFRKYLTMNPNNKQVRYYHDLLKQYLK